MKINKWAMSLPLGPEIQRINLLLLQFARELYNEYEPTRGPFPDFWQRLALWLENFSDEEAQKILFQFVPHLFFVGPREMESLYRTAFNHNFATWLIERLGANLDETNLPERLKDGVNKTWFCPITDSMRINGFYHLNSIEGRDYRPDWRSLARFADRGRILAFISEQGIERIVLLEDFVGNGSQIRKAVIFAAELRSNLPVLVMPLIFCPSGWELANHIQMKYPNVQFSPVLNLPPGEFLLAEPTNSEPKIHSRIRDLSLDTAHRLVAGLSDQQLEQAKKYVPFGWSKTGAMIVLHTNCPNNTLPIVFQRSSEWKPLFPRTSRL